VAIANVSQLTKSQVWFTIKPAKMRIHIIKFSKTFKHLREEKSFTQEQLAKELGVSRQAIISLERGRSIPSLPLALNFARFFEISLENIFGFQNEEERKEINTMSRDLLPWSPMREVSSLHEAIDRLFEESWPVSTPKGASVPTVNVFEKQNKVYVEADVPGVKEEDLSIEVGVDSLTLQGERKFEEEIKEKDYYRKETSYGTFSRTIPLPSQVNKDKAEAELKDGTLTIILPKKAKVKPKVTKVKVRKK